MSNKACKTHTQATRPTAWGHVSCATEDNVNRATSHVCASGFLPDLCPALTLPLARTEGRPNATWPNKLCLFGEIRGLGTFPGTPGRKSQRWYPIAGRDYQEGRLQIPLWAGERGEPWDGDARSSESDSPRREACCTPGSLLHSGRRAQVQHTHKRPQDPAAPAEPQELRAES